MFVTCTLPFYPPADNLSPRVGGRCRGPARQRGAVGRRAKLSLPHFVGEMPPPGGREGIVPRAGANYHLSPFRGPGGSRQGGREGTSSARRRPPALPLCPSVHPLCPSAHPLQGAGGIGPSPHRGGLGRGVLAPCRGVPCGRPIPPLRDWPPPLTTRDEKYRCRGGEAPVPPSPTEWERDSLALAQGWGRARNKNCRAAIPPLRDRRPMNYNAPNNHSVPP